MNPYRDMFDGDPNNPLQGLAQQGAQQNLQLLNIRTLSRQIRIGQISGTVESLTQRGVSQDDIEILRRSNLITDDPNRQNELLQEERQRRLRNYRRREEMRLQAELRNAEDPTSVLDTNIFFDN